MQPESVELCVKCTTLVFSDYDTSSTTTGVDHWPTLRALIISSNRCALCRLYSDALEQECRDMKARFLDVTDSHLLDCTIELVVGKKVPSDAGLLSQTVTASIHLSSHGFAYETDFNIACCDPASEAAQLPSWQTFPSSRHERLIQIQKWLHECESRHTGCESTLPQFRPSRLIEVSPPGNRPPRLVYSTHLPRTNIRYATLSYCWGGIQPVLTTTSTLGTFLDELPFPNLARTHQEAIDTTRALGIPYLWIDALCIVQDDASDWEAEAQDMASIYLTSVLTIAASEANTYSGGCFKDAPPRDSASSASHRRFMSVIDVYTGQSKLLHVTYSSAKLGHIPSLHQRGWTLQESVLSRRLVQVINSELQWRCRSKLYWESGTVYKDGERMHGSVPVFDFNSLGSNEHDAVLLNQIWSEWMESYSSRKLTFEKDRLPAIAGLTLWYKALTGDTPCLGLWRLFLHEGLGWGATSEVQQGAQSNLPSWCPLSSDQPVRYDYWSFDRTKDAHTEYYVQIIDCEITWTGKEHVSEIRSSSLSVEGPVRYLTFSDVTEMEECDPPYFKDDGETIDDTQPVTPNKFRCAARFDIPRQKGTKKWSCLLLSRRATRGYELGGENFLILVAVDNDSGEAQFRRAGIGSLGRRRDQVESGEVQDWKFDVKSRQKIVLV